MPRLTECSMWESNTGIWFYHLAHEGATWEDGLTLCGEKLRHTCFDETYRNTQTPDRAERFWGFRGDGKPPYKYCRECDAKVTR